MYYFELFYVLSLPVIEFAALRKLERAETDKLKKALKFGRSPLFFVLCLLFAFGMIIGIPQLLDFEFNPLIFSIGLLAYFAFHAIWAKPRWDQLKTKVVDDAMVQRGRGGQRAADLSVRKLTDYAPRWALASPYVLLFLGFLAGFLFSPAATSEESLHIDLGNMNLFFLLMAGIMTLVLTKMMDTRVKQPIDWRSDDPASYAEKVHASLRKMVRWLLVVEVFYVISAVTAHLTFPHLLMPEKGFPNPIHFRLFSSVVFLVVGVGSIFANQRTLARLEEERWTTPT